MAKVGLRHPVFAPITAETSGSAITYDSAIELKDAILANIAWTVGSNPLYASNVMAENDNGILGGKISFSTTYITDAQKAALLGHIAESSGSYSETDDAAPAGGFGYIVDQQVTTNGVVAHTCIGYWLHKTQFAQPADESATKAGSIEWKTPTIEGDIMGAYIDDTGKVKYREYKTFDTYAEAKTWVDAKAGLPATQVATPTATPVAGEVAAGTDITLACATSGAAIHYTTDGSTPTSGSMVYSEAISVYEATTIKAIGIFAGYTDSDVLSAAYTIS